jgi:hypothetical protein
MRLPGRLLAYILASSLTSGPQVKDSYKDNLCIEAGEAGEKLNAQLEPEGEANEESERRNMVCFMF